MHSYKKYLYFCLWIFLVVFGDYLISYNILSYDTNKIDFNYILYGISISQYYYVFFPVVTGIIFGLFSNTNKYFVGIISILPISLRFFLLATNNNFFPLQKFSSLDYKTIILKETDWEAIVIISLMWIIGTFTNGYVTRLKK